LPVLVLVAGSKAPHDRAVLGAPVVLAKRKIEGRCGDEGWVVTASASGSPFEAYSPDDVVQLIKEYPLAWVCPRGGTAGLPALLPLLADVDDPGRITALVGHMARRNPLFAALEAEPEAMILFTGPQAYVSPACVSNPAWAPTWNYVQVRIDARIRFEPAQSAAALDRLTTAMEAKEPTGWTPAQLGARYAPMERAIIAFRAEVLALHGRFKLGQDEPPDTLDEILARHTDPALVRWMQRANAARI
jgi:transcriptional regulator